jgi:hypothetical protein
MAGDGNLSRATSYLSLQLALLEDAVDLCAAEFGLGTHGLRYSDRRLTAMIGGCKTEALTLAEAGVDLGELPILLDAANALSLRARRSIHDAGVRGVRGEEVATVRIGNTGDRMTPDALYALVREVGTVAIRLVRLARSRQRV